MAKDSIVIYDVTDQLTDIQQFIEPTPVDQFIIDNIPVTSRNPAEITLNAKIYINGVLQTAYPINQVTIKWYRYTTNWSEITAADTVVTAIDTNKQFIKIVQQAKIKLEVTYSQNGATHISTDTYDIVDIDTTNQPVVTLSHQAVMFNYNQSGTTTVMQHVYYKGTDITASVFGTGKWEWTPIGQSSWIQKASGVSSIDIGISDAGTAGNVFRYSVTVNGVVYQQMFTVQRQVAPSISQVLTNEVHTLPATSSGTVTSFTGSGTGIYVIQNGVKLVPVTVTPVDNQFSVGTVAFTGGTATIGQKTADTTNNIMKFDDYTQVGADVVTATFPVTYKLPNTDAQTINLVQTLTKSKAGVDSTVYYITQSDNVFYKATNGTLTPTSITFNQYSITGNQAPVAFTGYWRVSKSGTPLYQDPTTQQSTYTFSALEAGTARYDVYLFKDAGKSQLLDQQTVIRVDQGVTGQPATSYWLDVSPSVIIVTKDGKFNGAASQSLTATGYSQTGAGAPTTGAGTIKYKIPPSETETTYVSSVSISDSTKTQVIFNMYIGAQLVDTVSVPIIKEAVDQITVVLSNQNVTIPADENKLPLSSQSTGTKINVYEGITQLTAKLKADTLSAGQFKVSADPSVTNQSGTTITTGFTVGGITASGTTLTVADHSITETGATSYVVKYIIQYKRQNGTDGTVEVYQNIAKQITGMQPFYIVLQQDNNMITVVGSSCTITQTVYRNGSQQTDTNYDYKWTVDGVAKVPNGGSQMGSSGYYNGTNQNKVTLTDANITTKAVVECDARVHQTT